jgi:hypothetical protein
MARNCPKNTSSFNRTNANAREASDPVIAKNSTSPTTPVSPVTSTVPPIPPKLSHAQQIRAIEELMTEEEHSVYLDARDMGEDFCAAGY